MNYESMRNGDPMHEVFIPHRIPHAQEEQGCKGKARGRSRHKNNSKIV